MVLAGFAHPDHEREFDESDHAVIEGRASFWYPGYKGEDHAQPVAWPPDDDDIPF